MPVNENNYEVYDEMACQTLLETTDKKEAHATAFNSQCVLKLNGTVIKDYSC